MRGQLFFYGLIMFGLSGCGNEVKLDDDSASKSPTTEQVKQKVEKQPAASDPATQASSLAFNSSAELPKCIADREGALAYLKDEKVFKACSGGAWSEIAIKGDDGEDGDDGQDGSSCSVSSTGIITCGNTTFEIPNDPETLLFIEEEPVGQVCASGGTRFWQYKDENGDGMYQSGEEIINDTAQVRCNDQNDIAASIYCSGELGNSGIWFTYGSAQFENGIIHVYGSIRDGYFESTSSRIFSPDQNGFISAALSFQRDVQGANNAGWWEMGLDRSTLISTVTYHDAEVTGGEITWTLPPSACVLNAYTID